MMEKWEYLKELIRQLEKRHTLPDDAMLYVDIVIQCVEIGIRQHNTPTREAEIMTQVMKGKEDADS